MALGPVMVDLKGTELDAVEREMLCHPLVGGVLLFTRNYASPEQLEALLAEIHALRSPRLLTAVDHEGGRVQRFRSGFTRLPAAAGFGRLYRQDPREGVRMAERAGWLMAVELRAVGVDFSFAPVLDLDRSLSEVIGDRAFAGEPEAVVQLARAYLQGMRHAGMAATGKHFPGHGGVRGDSHLELPVDDRPFDTIELEDLVPFERLAGELAGVMPAHVIYSQVDERPAGFSPWWIRRVLRERLGFQGVVFSDDLSMAGAAYAGGYGERARMALDAGCDMVLVCNNPQGAAETLDALAGFGDPASQMRLVRLHGRHPVDRHALHRSEEWRRTVARILDFEQAPAGDLAL
ncbi:beta-N-acetylhexosaminidase [Endothiovibrio diazotrophicus]